MKDIERYWRELCKTLKINIYKTALRFSLKIKICPLFKYIKMRHSFLGLIFYLTYFQILFSIAGA